MAELTTIQKEIEARNVGLGRKLLAYEVMLGALKEVVGWLDQEIDTPLTYEHFDRMEKMREKLTKTIAKAENKP